MDININPTIVSALISVTLTICILLINGVRQRSAFDQQIKSVVSVVDRVPSEYLRKDLFDEKIKNVELKLDNINAMISVSKEIGEIKKILTQGKRS